VQAVQSLRLVPRPPWGTARGSSRRSRSRQRSLAYAQKCGGAHRGFCATCCHSAVSACTVGRLAPGRCQAKAWAGPWGARGGWTMGRRDDTQPCMAHPLVQVKQRRVRPLGAAARLCYAP
jgi:hypothetical protein